MSRVWRESHRYSDGRCAWLAWAQLDRYQLHYVQQFRKTSGDSLSVGKIEEYLTTLHGDMSSEDAFFDNRVGFFVESIAPFAASLKADRQPFLLEKRSLFMEVPGGIIVELMEAHKPVPVGLQ